MGNCPRCCGELQPCPLAYLGGCPETVHAATGEHGCPSPALTDVVNGLGALLLAGAYVTQPAVWPGFQAYVEAMTGADYSRALPGMRLAIDVVDQLRDVIDGAITMGGP